SMRSRGRAPTSTPPRAAPTRTPAPASSRVTGPCARPRRTPDGAGPQRRRSHPASAPPAPGWRLTYLRCKCTVSIHRDRRRAGRAIPRGPSRLEEAIMSATETKARRTATKANAQRTFHQTWFPVALASELGPGQLLGQDVLGTRVVCYRDPDGRPVVQSAYCPHLGADLSVGELVDGQVRCAYHHWRFDCAGRCVDIPTGDKIPPGARIATYPSREAWGLIWAFNGATPLFAVPGIPDAEESELVVEAHYRGTRAVDPWVSVSNGVDFQHLRALHGLAAVDPEHVTVGAHAIEYAIHTEHYLQ